MKKFVTFFFVLTASFLFAQELTADTPAVEQAWYLILWHQLISDIVPSLIKIIAGAIATTLTVYASGAYDAIRKYLANTRYNQETGILMESVKTAILRKAKERNMSMAEMIKEISSMYADLKLDDGERRRLHQLWDEIVEMASEIAKDQLPLIRGFAKDAGGKWVAERVDLLLGELVSAAIGLLSR